MTIAFLGYGGPWPVGYPQMANPLGSKEPKKKDKKSRPSPYEAPSKLKMGESSACPLFELTTVLERTRIESKDDIRSISLTKPPYHYSPLSLQSNTNLVYQK